MTSAMTTSSPPPFPDDPHRRDRRDLAPAVLGGDGQERADPALRLAARCDGRPHAGLGLDPRGDDGDRWRLPDRPIDADDRLAPGVQLLICVDRVRTALLAAAIAVTQNDLKRVMAYSTVSQLGYMFMALGAGVGDVRPARDRRGDVPPVHPRLLQGPAVPRLGERDARDGRRHRHAAVPRSAPPDADHLLDVRRGRAGPFGDPAVLRLLQQGRDPAGARAASHRAHEQGYGWTYSLSTGWRSSRRS